MRGTLKRLVSLVMALAMVFALVACEGKLDKKEEKVETTLVGSWKGNMDMTEFVIKGMKEQSGVDLDLDYFGVTMYMTFNEDGTCEIQMDQDTLEETMEDYISAMWPATVKMMADRLGVSESAALELMESQGMTKETLKEQMDFSAMLNPESMSTSGTWRLEGDQLYITGNDAEEENQKAVTIEFGVGTFSIIDAPFEEDQKEMAESVLPMVFERQ